MEDPRPYRRIHAELVRRIDGGTYPAGSRVDVGLVADEFDVTRVTAGKAFRMLAGEGRIEYFRGMGWFVTGRQPDSLT